jgi:hypothetical protein
MDDLALIKDEVPDASNWFWFIGHGGCAVVDVHAALNAHPDVRLVLSWSGLMLIPHVLMPHSYTIFDGCALRNDRLLTDWFREPQWRASTFRAVMEAFRGRIQGSPRAVGDMLCNYAGMMPLIQTIFPGSRVLAVERNPWDMAAAKLRSGYMGFSPDKPPLEAAVQTLESSVANILSVREVATRYNDLSLIISLESLACDRDAVLAKAFEHLGVDPGLVIRPNLPVFRKEDVGRWEEVGELQQVRSRLEAGERVEGLTRGAGDFLVQTG